MNIQKAAPVFFPSIRPINDNIGIVPPYLGGSPVPKWLKKDLGYEATTPTTNPSWRADFRK